MVIGINHYHEPLKTLITAVSDADAVAAELRKDYAFADVKELTDDAASRSGIMKALNYYRQKLGKEDSLLIYYAGHGYREDKTGKSYWLPIDAEDNDTTNYVSADDITTILKAMDAKHVLVVSDSCYSGGLTRDPNVHMTSGDDKDYQTYIANVSKRKSRDLLASGGNEPVLDGGGDGTHSIFASVFLDALQNPPNDRFTVTEIFPDIRMRVGGRSPQNPEHNPIGNSGHDGGDFIFEHRKLNQ